MSYSNAVDVLEHMLLLITNRKLNTGFQMTSLNWMTLNALWCANRVERDSLLS